MGIFSSSGVSYAAVAQAVTKAERRITHSAATDKVFNELCATFKIDSAEEPR